MSANETFCLRFNEFDRVIKSCWQELQRENDACDITLACEERQIKSHKFVISAFSPVLRSILKLHPNPHPLIYLRKVNPLTASHFSRKKPSVTLRVVRNLRRNPRVQLNCSLLGCLATFLKRRHFTCYIFRKDTFP